MTYITLHVQSNFFSVHKEEQTSHRATHSRLFFCLHTEPSHAHVIGTLGRNITLRFIFNSSIKNNSHIGIYTTGEKKIADNLYEEKSFDLHPQNSSVCYHITNLILNHSNTYWASLFDKGGPKKSNEVQLIIKEKNSSTGKDRCYDYKLNILEMTPVHGRTTSRADCESVECKHILKSQLKKM